MTAKITIELELSSDDRTAILEELTIDRDHLFATRPPETREASDSVVTAWAKRHIITRLEEANRNLELHRTIHEHRRKQG